MDVTEAIRERREITSYTDEPISDDILKKVEDAGVFAPTGNNLPSKYLIVVKDRNTLDELADTTPYMKWKKEAQAAIVVIGKPEVSKYWLQDASFACAFIWLEAVEVGLGSAFGAVYNLQDEQESGRRETYVRDLLGIPEECRVVAGLGLGYPGEPPKPKNHVPRDEVVRYEKF
ncbi:nitroreductase family protein [Halobacillus amylolyticus]|uniref:Nitroreductase family protein n=1 Tax=Halobacillus amylolyticus TaxID=2932259 RepID=A0ABY4HGV6_9BACI|nr:nitroreductase family protein [Halobacillus amylolyticus]UOR13095.1 nitroreductase family protein [Halobacillus amylolyticus]